MSLDSERVREWSFDCFILGFAFYLMSGSSILFVELVAQSTYNLTFQFINQFCFVLQKCLLNFFCLTSIQLINIIQCAFNKLQQFTIISSEMRPFSKRKKSSSQYIGSQSKAAQDPEAGYETSKQSNYSSNNKRFKNLFHDPLKNRKNDYKELETQRKTSNTFAETKKQLSFPTIAPSEFQKKQINNYVVEDGLSRLQKNQNTIKYDKLKKNREKQSQQNSSNYKKQELFKNQPLNQVQTDADLQMKHINSTSFSTSRDKILDHVREIFRKFYTDNKLDADQIEECCSSIADQPQNYEEILVDFLSKRSKSLSIIKEKIRNKNFSQKEDAQSQMKQKKSSSQAEPTNILQCIKLIFQNNESKLDADEIEECCTKIAEQPLNFENILTEYMGTKSKCLPLIKEKIQSNKFFQKQLIKKKVKLIHTLPHSQELIDVDKSKLYCFEIQAKEWAFQEISKEVEKNELGLISIASRRSQVRTQNFIEIIYDYLIDFLNRRLDLSEFVTLINTNAINYQGLEAAVKQMLKNLTCTDLAALASILSTDKACFGALLSKVEVPIPIIFKSYRDENLVEYYQTHILEQVLRLGNYHVIVNFGSKETQDKGKTTFIAELYVLKNLKKYLNRSCSELHQGSVHVYTQIPIKHQGKELIIFDFQGNHKTQSVHYRNLLEKLIDQALVVYYHVDSKQLNIPDSKMDNEITQKLKNTLAKVFIVRRDCSKTFPNYQYEDLEVISIPKITQKLSPEIAVKNKSVLETIEKTQLFAQHLKFSKLQNLEANLKNENLVAEIITEIQKNEIKHLFKTMFPKLHNDCSLQKLQQKIEYCEFQYSRNLENTLVDDQKGMIQQKIALQEASAQIKVSKVVQKILNSLKDNFGLLQGLSDKLALWKNNATSHLQDRIIEKEAELAKITDPQAKRLYQAEIADYQQQISLFDISVDTVFSEIISLDEARDQQRLHTDLINMYYRDLLNNIKPINLIEGKSLKFGNTPLEKLLKELSQTYYQEKPVFVISVIGAQSSAKSTLMNYLFKCDFATAAGRCTKGVYFTIVQSDDRVIVVIDTEGLLSVSARDDTFDVQIASFIMLISDLVIFNNKGEVNKTLRDLIGVCLYAVHELNRQKSKQSPYKPNEVVFAIRDQTDDGANTQKKMLADIIQHLKENSLVEYDKYLHFTDSDIYPLQSAFMTQSYNLITKTESNHCFGKAIIAFRSKIMDKLTTSKFTSLQQFYGEAETTWTAIRNCGMNLFNFKSMYEIGVKKKILETLEEMMKTTKIKYKQCQDEAFAKYRQNLIQNEEDVFIDLKQLLNQTLKDTILNFEQECKSVKNIEWVKYYHPNIESELTRMHRIYVDAAQEIIFRAKQTKEDLNLSTKLNEIYQTILSKDVSQNQANKSIKQIERQLIESNEQETQKLKQQLKEPHSKMFALIKRQCKVFVENLYFEKKVVGFKFDMLRDHYQRCKCESTTPKQYLKIFGQIDFMAEQFEPTANIIKKFVKQIKNRIDASIVKNKLTTLDKIQSLLEGLKLEIESQYDELSGELLTQEKSKVSGFKLKSKTQVVGFFLAGCPQAIRAQIVNNQLNQSDLRIGGKKELIKEKHNEIVQAYKSKDNIKEIAQNWIQKIIKKVLQVAKQQSFDRIKSHLITTNINMDPAKMIQKAMNYSINFQKKFSKQRMINCFKMITNPNRFIVQLLHKQPQIRCFEEKITDNINAIIIESQKSFSNVLQLVSKDVENYHKWRSLPYYSIRYNIDLDCYQKVLSDSQILPVLKQILEQVDKNGHIYDSQICKIAKSTFSEELSKEVRKYISEKIEPEVVGCQARCPGCGIKCKKHQGHKDGHQAVEDTHLQLCFKGIPIHKTKLISHTLCYNLDLIEKSKMVVGSGDNQKTLPILKWVQEYHSRWLDHFEKATHSGMEKREDCEFVWQNIGEMLLKYSFTRDDVINDSKGGECQLTEKDIKAYKLENYRLSE